MKKVWNAVKPVLAQILTSKKALATIAAVLVGLGGKIGLELPTEAVVAIVGALAAYVVGQGIADNGKEAVKEEAKLLAAESSEEG